MDHGDHGNHGGGGAECKMNMMVFIFLLRLKNFSDKNICVIKT
jgi:hypothetical protein